MKPRKSTPIIRAAGQRSIPSTFTFRSAPNNNNSKCLTSEDNSSSTSKRVSGHSTLSLSAFLNRKLHSTSVLPFDKVEKEKLSESVNHYDSKEFNAIDDKNGCGGHDGKRKRVIEDSVFKQLNGKPGAKASKNTTESYAVPIRLEGDVKKHGQNHLVVLGDDPKPKRRRYYEIAGRNEKPRPLYNHYENGTGWWEPEREGIDSDEVGTTEIWEGVGSTTLGGDNWH